MPEIMEKIKPLLAREVYTILVLVFVALASFGLGRLSAQPKPQGGVTITKADASLSHESAATVSQQEAAAAPAQTGQSKGLLVASKNSTKYHYPWCPGAARIAEANKIWFNSIEEARAAGYEPAANCKGLE